MRRLKRHRITVILDVDHPVSSEAARAYIAEAIKGWACQYPPRSNEQEVPDENVDQILGGEVLRVAARSADGNEWVETKR